MTAAKLSNGQRLLAIGVVLLGLALTPIAFVVMYVTVTDLLRPSLGVLAWTVPVGTEVGFIGLFLADLLLEWAGKPLRWLPAVPYLLAAASIALNALAGDHALAGVLGHEVLPAVFFGYLIAGKSAVRRLAVSDEARRHEIALADAKAHARDMLRSACGPFWHLTAPVLLRRQLRSGRLPALVLEAVETGEAVTWEPAVEAWIASSVTLPERTREALRVAREAVPASTPEPVPAQAPALSPDVPETVPETAPRTSPGRAPKPVTKPALKLTAARSRGMSPEQVAEHVSAMLDEYGENVSLSKIRADLHVGADKATAALEIARRGRAQVVPIGARKQA